MSGPNGHEKIGRLAEAWKGTLATGSEEDILAHLQILQRLGYYPTYQADGFGNVTEVLTDGTDFEFTDFLKADN